MHLSEVETDARTLLSPRLDIDTGMRAERTVHSMFTGHSPAIHALSRYVRLENSRVGQNG